MRRTEQLQGLRLMKFEEVYGRNYRGELSQVEAAEILGTNERTFRRWRDRFEGEGAEGMCDRRLGRVLAYRAPADTGGERMPAPAIRASSCGGRHRPRSMVSAWRRTFCRGGEREDTD